jgi:hypothetical protein
MGWTTRQHYGRPSKKIIDEDLTWENEVSKVRPIKSAVVGFRTYYAALAVEDKASGKLREVFGIVVLIQRTKDEITTKELTEDCGPAERRCPAGILDLLSPTVAPYAIQWRADCRYEAERASKANRVRRGDCVLFRSSYAGSNRWYVHEKKGSSVLFSRTPDGLPVRLKGWKSRVLEVNPAA